jgi:hypothetical protein
VDIPFFLLPRLQCGGKDRAEAVRRKLGDQRRGSETHQLGLDYRGGPLARDKHDSPASVRAGDRAPCRDAAGAPVRLFDTFRGPHFTLLAFGAAHAETVARVNARYGPTVHAHAVIEPGNPAARTLSSMSMGIRIPPTMWTATRSCWSALTATSGYQPALAHSASSRTTSAR